MTMHIKRSPAWRSRFLPSIETLEARQLLAAAVLPPAMADVISSISLLDFRPHLHALKKVPKPAITILAIEGPDASGAVTLSGKTYARAKVGLDLGADGTIEQNVKTRANGRFQFTFDIQFGQVPVQLSATAKGKKPAKEVLQISRPDRLIPVISFQNVPSDVPSRQQATFSGLVSDMGTGVASLQVQIDGGSLLPVAIGASGNFSYTTSLPLDGMADGKHTVTFTAIDKAGNESVPSSFSFTLDTRPPTLTILSPAQGETSRSDPAITGHVADATSGVSALQAQVDGGALTPVAIDASGNFSFTPALPVDGTADGEHTVTFIATDAVGLSSQAALTFTLDHTDLPSPTQIAPPLSTTTTTSLLDATSFLYTGANAIQTGVAPGTITLERAAVLRGEVMDQAGNPLAGVTITVLDHPEFGQTYSRADGMLDLAVNGGGPLTVEYTKAGYLPVDRQIDVPWQDYAMLPDVAMSQLDSQVTTIDLASTQPFQVARGSVETDQDGTRQATLLFPQGEQATMTLPDGTTQALTTLHVRATEYTVGPDGPEAMPGTLPATSGYTYAVELSDDAAIAAGATRVDFAQAVPLYVENFLNFPVGMAVPTGYYDHASGQWIASPNGLVIKILDDSAGEADLDIDGSGKAASSSALAALGITDAERTQIAGLYQPGESLWRVPITHFTPWDCNWPYSPPPDAQAPDFDPNDVNDGNVDNPNQACGASVIGVENQTLGESIPIAGTPFSLVYESNRTSGGSVADRTLTIPLTNAIFPSDLNRIDLTISVAGRVFTQSFTPAANLSTIFTWDGLDGYGRPVQGSAPVSINIGYVYIAVYDTPANEAQAFAAFSGVPITIDRARQEITLSQKFNTVIQSSEAASDDLGGWTLDSHNQYDPITQVLHLGNGLDESSTSSLYETISTIAGNGSEYSSGDGEAATQASLQPSSVAAGPDGSIYIADAGLFVRRISPTGIITTVAGNGTSNFTGDDGLAINAGMNPTAIALGPDGSIYIVDSSNDRVRRIGPAGIITTVAGNGSPGFAGDSGDGGLATQARIFPSSIAVASDGTLFIGETKSSLVRRVGPDGIITTVAGNGSYNYSNYSDGQPATQVPIDPTAIAVDTEGNLLILNNFISRLLRVGSDGLISTIAGGNSNNVTGGDGGPATEASLFDPESLAVAPDGSIYIGEISIGLVRKVGVDGIITTVAGEDGGTSLGDGGPATLAELNPVSIAVDQNGNLIIDDADAGIGLFGGRIREVNSSSIINTIAGGSFVAGPGDLATQTGIYPLSVAVSPSGDLYIADFINNSIRKVSPDGTIINVAGDGQDGTDGYGGPATQAELDAPRAVALGPDGSLYIAEDGYDSYAGLILRVSPDGIITRIAGRTGTQPGFSGDGGPATDAVLDFGTSTSIAVAPDGSVYFADTDNYRIRRIGPDGIITTVAGDGTSGFGGDGGPAAQASLTYPSSIALGPDGSLYIGDADRVRRLSPSGIITTVAGGGTMAGDGIPATEADLSGIAFYPITIAVDSTGNIYIGENDFRIRRVGTDGIITTVAGTGIKGFSGDGGAAASAQLDGINALAVDAAGNLYVADNARVRRVEPVLPGQSPNDIIIPSQDGSEVYYFDQTGRQLQTLDALTGALIYSFGYDTAGRLTCVTDGDGNVTTIERNASGTPTAIVSPYGQQTSLTVNAESYLSKVVDPANESTALAYGTGGLLTSMTDPLGNASAMAYDAMGRLVSDENAADGVITLARTEMGNGSYKVITTNGVGGTNQYLVERMPDGSVRRTSIDGQGFATVTVTYSTGASHTTAPDGTQTTDILGPDPRYGMLAPVLISQMVTMPSGLTSTIADSRTVIDGSLSSGIAPANLTDTVTTNGEPSTSNYDGATRTITSTSAAGRTSVTTLDTKGRAVLVQVPGIANTSFTYDSRGRLTAVAQGSRTVTYAYDAYGNLAQITDPLGRSVSFSYDAADRLIQQTQPDGTTIAFSYDAAGNLIGLTPPGTSVNSFGYDADNRLTSSTPPAAGAGDDTTRYTYDLAGQVVEESLPDGSDVLFAYCACGRLTSITTPQGMYNYTYSSTTGDLASIASPDGSQLSYGYDGALLTSATQSGSVAGQVSWTYDANFQMSSESVNGGHTVNYAYDKDGLLTGAGELTLNRDATTGFLTGTTLGSVTDSYAYDSYGETSVYQATIGQSAAYEDDFTRNNLGLITRKVETIGGVTTTTDYGYDSDDRLITVTVNGVLSQSYTYDANGNRLSLTTPLGTVNGTYNAQDQLLTYGTTSYSYNANGQLLQATDSATGQTTRYTYDVFGNLTHVDLPGGHTIDYLIDGQDRRVGEKVDGVLTEGLTYSGQLQPVAETDGAGNVTERFVYGSGVNVPEYMVKDGVDYRFITDQLGSVRLVINAATGAIAEQIDYDAFGRIFRDTNPGFQPFGYAGGLYDSNTGLVHFGSRDYDSETGRWTTKDPSGLVGGYNQYGYVDQDPTNASDSFGLCPDTASDGNSNWLDDAIDAIHSAIDAIGRGTDWIGAHVNPVYAGLGLASLGLEASLLALLEADSITVIGSYPAYVERALQIGADFFSVPLEEWNAMTYEEQVAANLEFLDSAIARGDIFELATPIEEVEPGAFYEMELQYLFENGYTLSGDGTQLLPP